MAKQRYATQLPVPMEVSVPTDMPQTAEELKAMEQAHQV